MSAAKRPYDIRNERGQFVRVSPNVRVKLEAMRPLPSAPSGGIVYLGTFHPPAQSRLYDSGPQKVALFPEPKKIGWLERIIRRWMWRRA